MPGPKRTGARRRGSGGAVVACVLPLAWLLFAAAAVAGPSLSARDDRGVEVRLARPPARIVSLAPSLTEIVFLLGAQDRLVGVTRFCNVPPEAARLPRIGGVVDPDVERIVAARPDLVLCTTDGNPKEKVRILEESGIPCFAVGPQGLSAVFGTIERIGTLVGLPERGRREAESLRNRTARVSGADPCSARRPKVLFAVSTSPIIVAGSGTFLDELIRRAGGENAARGYSGRYPRLSTEQLIAASPDLVLLAAMAGVERFPDSVLRWREIPAFRDDEVHSLDGDLVTRPGPRMVDALEQVARILAKWCTRARPVRRPDEGKAR
ncbi:MAG: ABC transporter substrate-binding protein [Deltaproteobacteria bacterium]